MLTAQTGDESEQSLISLGDSDDESPQKARKSTRKKKRAEPRVPPSPPALDSAAIAQEQVPAQNSLSQQIRDLSLLSNLDVTAPPSNRRAPPSGLDSLSNLTGLSALERAGVDLDGDLDPLNLDSREVMLAECATSSFLFHTHTILATGVSRRARGPGGETVQRRHPEQEVAQGKCRGRTGARSSSAR